MKILIQTCVCTALGALFTPLSGLCPPQSPVVPLLCKREGSGCAGLGPHLAPPCRGAKNQGSALKPKVIPEQTGNPRRRSNCMEFIPFQACIIHV